MNAITAAERDGYEAVFGVIRSLPDAGSSYDNAMRNAAIWNAVGAFLTAYKKASE